MAEWVLSRIKFAISTEIVLAAKNPLKKVRLSQISAKLDEELAAVKIPAKIRLNS